MYGLSVIIPVKMPEPYLIKLIKDIHNNLYYVKHEILVQTEVGLTNAVIKGVEKSRYDTIVVMDADGSHNPSYLRRMLKLSREYDLVIGSKIGKDDNSILRRVISRIYRWFASAMLDLNVNDPMSGFVMAKKELFISLKSSTDYKFLLQLLTGDPSLNVMEMPIFFRRRQMGKSKASFVTGLKTLSSIIKIWLEKA